MQKALSPNAKLPEADLRDGKKKLNVVGISRSSGR